MIKIKSIKNKSGISASKLPRMSVFVVARSRKEWMQGKSCFKPILKKAFGDTDSRVNPVFYVYILWRNKKIIYIGKSSSLQSRLQSHRKKLNFTHASILNFEKEALQIEVEALLIEKHKTVLNKEHNPNYNRKTKKHEKN